MGSTKLPSRYYGLDTEDDGKGNPHLFVIVREDGERGVYRTREACHAALEALAAGDLAEGFRAEVWCTNLSYDLVNVFWPALDAVLPTFNRMGRVIAARHLGLPLLYRDTVAFLPASVRELGEIVGLPKLEFAPEDPEYCARDAEITVKAACLIRDGLAELGVEHLGFSAAGTAYKDWSRRVGAPCVPDEFARGAYFGGRVEVLRTGSIRGPIFHWDVRSMYPSCMLGAFPVPGTSVDGWKDDEMPAWVRARVRVLDDQFLGPLPVRADGGGVTFPVGEFEGEWMSDELIRACDDGTAEISKVIAARTWTATCHPFTEWVERLWGFRRRGGVAKIAAKLLMNSLYGKFGSGTEMLQVRKGHALPYRWGERYSFGIVNVGGFNRCSRFPWAALVTARARMRLLALLEAAGASALYCDTDSVFATSDALRDREGLGLGDLERLPEIEAMDIIAPKVYRVKRDGKWNYRAKGFPLQVAIDSEGEKLSVEKAGAELFSAGGLHYRAPRSLRRGLAVALRPGVWQDDFRRLTRGAGGRREFPRGRTLPVKLGEGD